MKKILLSLVLLIGSVQLCTAQNFNNVVDIFQFYKSRPQANYIVVNKDNLSLYSQIGDFKMPKGVEKVEILSMKKSKSKDHKAILSAMDKFAAQGYQTLASTAEKDEIAKILGKSDGNVFSEIIICDIEDNETDIVRITGNINPKDLSSLDIDI
ncbi:MAG: DUF4252 domain-containing protein [Prevotella sp.]|jgi:hypothetical protein